MRNGILTVMLALALSVAMVSTANAGDEFEDGFKTELGAISARAAVGLGVGLVGRIVHGGPHYVSSGHGYYAPYRSGVYVERRVYVSPHPRWHYGHYRHHGHHHHRGHHYHHCR